MAKKTAALLLVIAVMLLTLTGCFGRKKTGKAFAVPILEEPVSLDPQIARSVSERLVAANCYEGLVRIGEDGGLTEGAAESWTVSEDGLVFTFRLRRDVRWGLYPKHKAVLGEGWDTDFDRTVTAGDFRFGLQRALDPQTGSGDARLLKAIESIEVPDDFTLRITLKYADENFLYALTVPGAMPCDEEFFRATKGRYGLDAKYMLCNGPFHLLRWNEGGSLRLGKNTAYCGSSQVCPASVTLYLNGDAKEAAHKTGELIYDAAFLSQVQMDSIQNVGELFVRAIPNVTCSLIFNQRRADFQNLNLRLAVCRALRLPQDEEGRAYADGLVPLSCRIGARDPASGKPAALFSPDAEAAKKAFSSALSELGKSSVAVSVLCAEKYEAFVRQLVQGLQKTLGVKFAATVNVLPENEAAAAIRDGEYDAALYPFRADTVFAGDFLESFAGENVLGYDDEGFRAKAEAIEKSSGSNEALRTACREAENYLLGRAVAFPLFYENSYFVASKKTEGIYFGPSAAHIFFIHAKKS